MTQQIIRIGATPNDGNGDPLRTAFGKINNNFTELFNSTNSLAAAPDGGVQYRASNNLKTIAYNNGVWVVFGTPARYYRSLDGLQFDLNSYLPDITTVINSVRPSLTGFIAVGDNGIIITSADSGETWVTRNSGVSVNLQDVHYNPDSNVYVAVGDDGTVITSTDTVTWTGVSSGVTSRLNSITYNGSILGYVVCGNAGTIITSPTSSSWTTQGSGTPNDLLSVTTNINQYVITGTSGLVLLSVNGVTWQPQNSGTVESLTGIASGLIANSRVFMVTGSNGVSLTSNNGANWTLVSTGSTSQLSDVSYNQASLLSNTGFFYTVGSNGSIFSTGATDNWTNRSVPSTFAASGNFIYDDINNQLTVGSVNSSNGNISANIVIANAVTTDQIVVSGISNLGDVANVRIAGGVNGQVLSTDGNGNLSWIPGTVITANISDIITANVPNTWVNQTFSSQNTIQVGNADLFYLNQAVAFTGTVFGDLSPNVTYYINNILSNTQVTVSTTIGGPNAVQSSSLGNCWMQGVDTEVITSTENWFTEGIQVTITDVVGMTQLNGRQYFADVRTSSSFGLFEDANLTIPVNSLTYGNYEGYGRAIALTGGGGNASGVTRIVAGNNITITPAGGTGVVTISSTGGGGNANVVSIPAIYFTATVDGNNQSFSNSLLSSYESADDLTVFLNGSLLENGFYTLSGSTLTVTTEIQTGDSIDIIRQFAANVISGNSTPGGNNTELQYNNNGTFGGVTTFTYDGANISLGDISNVKISGGNNGQIIATDGNGTLYWANGGTDDYSNANVKSYLESGFDGNIVPSENLVYSLGSAEKQWKDIHVGGNTIFLSNIPLSVTSNGNLAFDGTELAFTGPNNNQDVQTSGNIIANVFIGNSITLSGTITANTANFVTLDTTSANLGTVENVTILGGEQNQVLSTDGSGNLQWIDRLSGIGPSGPVNSVQFNAGFGNFGGSSFLTYDSANTTLNVSGNLLANSISIGTGVYSFNRTFVYSAVTNSTLPDQEIYAVDAETTSGMDFMIISTDESSKSRQTTRFSVLHYSGNISYTETQTMVINQYLGNWNISYDPGSVIRDPQIVLTFSPETSNVIYHRMMITTYEP